MPGMTTGTRGHSGAVGSRLARAWVTAVLFGIGIGGSLAGCETVPPASSDTAAPALIDVVGKPADHAVELLRNAGYSVAVVDAHGDPVAATSRRLVVSQQPAGGTTIAAGRRVTLRLGDRR